MLLRHDPERGGENFMRLMARVHSEPGEWTLPVLEEFRESFERFAAALARVLPELSQEELHWRIFFLIGVLAHSLGASFKLKFFSGAICNLNDVEKNIRRLTAFAAAGMRAPLPQDGETE
jgi:hypothetical protein